MSNGLQTSGSLPILQCRTKIAIKAGSLRFFPHKGQFVRETAMSQRSTLESRLRTLQTCNMLGVKASVKAVRKRSTATALHHLAFLVYSPLGEKGLVTTSAASGGTSTVGYVAPFWAVMLTDRDNQDMVNMMPYTDEFDMSQPTPKYFPITFSCNLKVTLSFLN